MKLDVQHFEGLVSNHYAELISAEVGRSVSVEEMQGVVRSVLQREGYSDRGWMASPSAFKEAMSKLIDQVVKELKQ